MSVTGTPVGRAGEPVDWDDTERQHLAYQVEVTSDYFINELDPAGTDTPPVAGLFTNLLTADVAGGLDRGELAELIALKFHVGSDAAVTADGTVLMQTFVLGLDDVPEGLFGGGSTNYTEGFSGVDATDPGHPTGDGSNASLFRGGVEDNDGDLHRWTTGYTGQIEDEVNGTGLGSSLIPEHDHVHFRELLGGGAGPVFDRHSELHCHWATNQQGAVYNSQEYQVAYDLVWNIFDDPR